MCRLASSVPWRLAMTLLTHWQRLGTLAYLFSRGDGFPAASTLPRGQSGLAAWPGLWEAAGIGEAAGWGPSKVTNPRSLGRQPPPAGILVLPVPSQRLGLLALRQLGVLSQVRAPGEDCFAFGSSLSVGQGGRIPRGRHWIPALARLSGFLCLSLEAFLSRGGNKRLGEDECFVQGDTASGS